jgi:hypothetical protein
MFSDALRWAAFMPFVAASIMGLTWYRTGLIGSLWLSVGMIAGATGFMFVVALAVAGVREGVAALVNRADTRMDLGLTAKMGIAKTTILVALCLFVLSTFAVKAFSVPWSWTGDQIVFVVMYALVGVLAVVWGRVWWMGGYPLVKERWAAQMAAVEKTRSRYSGFAWPNVLLWTAIVATFAVILLLS